MVQFRPVIFSTNRIIELRLPPWNFDEPRGRVSNRTSWFYPPVILFLTCLVLFLLGLDKIDEASDPAYEDTISYLKVATFLQDHGGLANFWTLFIKGEHKAVLQHPLYPLLLASFGVEPHELFAAGKMLSLIVGVAVVATCFLIARNLYGNLVAYLATLLLAFNVTFLRTVSHVMCESLLTLFVLLSVYWMITGVEKERHWPWAGAAAGFAYLTKGTGFLLLPVFTVTAILGAGFRSLSRRWFWLFFVFFALIASPLIVRNLVVYNQPFYEGANSRVPWLDNLEGFYQVGTGWATKFPEKVWDEDRFPTMRSYLATHSWGDILARLRHGMKKEAQLLLDSLDLILLPQERYVGHLVFLSCALSLALASTRARHGRHDCFGRV